MEDQAEQHQKWWQQIKRPLVIGISAVSVLLVALIFVEVRANGTGFAGKTLWDWLQLMSAFAIPVVVGFGAVWFTTRQGKVADAENKDNQRETALQAYIDKISDLFLEKKLRDSAEEDETRKVARVRTLTILHRLDADRKGSVLQFLYESGLIDKGRRVIDLGSANLSYVHLESQANLKRADLSSTNLSGAILNSSNLREANLIFANLRGANLVYADLSYADLSGANLSGADLGGANLMMSYLQRANLSAFGEIDLTQFDPRKIIVAGLDIQEILMRGVLQRVANLNNTDLRFSNLEGAIVTTEQLAKAKSLKDATMPDGSIHP